MPYQPCRPSRHCYIKVAMQCKRNELQANTPDGCSPTCPLTPETLRQLTAVPQLATIHFSQNDNVDITSSMPVSKWHKTRIWGAVLSTYQRGADRLVLAQTFTWSHPCQETIPRQKFGGNGTGQSDSIPNPKDKVEILHARFCAGSI